MRKRNCLTIALVGSICLILLIAGLSPVTVFAAEGTVPGSASDAEYCGEYFLESGKRVSICREGVVSEMTRLVMTNWETGRVGRLEAAGVDRFVARSTAADGEVGVRFGRNRRGDITHLLVQVGREPPVRAERRKTFTEEPVRFNSADVVLAGTLKLPRGRGRFPAVVLVHGSGPGERQQLETMARFFVHLGIAALTYDKRGCGASTGNWKSVDLDVLADDALAGVALLCSRPDIDRDRVGLWGISQGGWIVPLAASRSRNVAFAVNHSGPGTSLRRQDTYMMSNVLGFQGVSPADIELVTKALNALYDYGWKKTSADALDQAIERLREKPGLEDFEALSSRHQIPDSLYARQRIGDPAWFFHLDPDRDVLEAYSRLRCPVLVIYGRYDYTVPVDESMTAINTALEASAHPDYRVEVLDHTGHGTLIVSADAPHEPVQPLHVSGQYFSLLTEWLSGHGFTLAGR